MSDRTVYALIAMSDTARVFDRVQDQDIAEEAIYAEELGRRLGPYGISIVEVEISGRPTGELANALAELGLGE